jgi:hypothetical protein
MGQFSSPFSQTWAYDLSRKAAIKNLWDIIPKSPEEMKKLTGTGWCPDILINLLHLIILIEQIWQPEHIMQD